MYYCAILRLQWEHLVNILSVVGNMVEIIANNMYVHVFILSDNKERKFAIDSKYFWSFAIGLFLNAGISFQ